MKRFVLGFLAAVVFAFVMGEVVAQEESSPTASSSYVEMPATGDSWSFLPEVEPSTIYSAKFDELTSSMDWEKPVSLLGSKWDIDTTLPMPVPPFGDESGYSLNYHGFNGSASPTSDAVSATSPVIALAGHTDGRLRFRCALMMFGIYGFDTTQNQVVERRYVRILSADGTLLKSVQLFPSGQGEEAPIAGEACGTWAWHEHEIQLLPDWESIRVEFRVEMDAGVFSTWMSWSADDVVVQGIPKSIESAVAAAEESKPEPAGGSGSCGCVGAEAILLLGILAVGRRRKRNS